MQFDYRVNGVAQSAFDKLAPAVNAMLSEQLDRLQRYAETGNGTPAAKH